MKEDKLLEDIQDILKEEWFKELIEQKAQEKEDTTSVSKIIGELYIYAFATRSCKSEDVKAHFKEFLNKHKQEKNNARNKSILKTIAKQNGISEGEIDTNPRIREIFLQNYCKNGYVMHSFSEENLKTLNEKGFLSLEEWKQQEDVNEREDVDKKQMLTIDEVAKKFEEHGVVKACGTYPFYSSGGGLYVEQDPRKIYEHATFAPEWFYEFTGSEHNSLTSEVAKHPLITRDKEACETNVKDLCINSRTK